MQITYKRATIEDIEILTKTRIEVLRAANKLTDETDMSEVEKQSYEYYAKALNDGTHTAYLVFDGERFVGAGGVSAISLEATEMGRPLYEKIGFINMNNEMELT